MKKLVSLCLVLCLLLSAMSFASTETTAADVTAMIAAISGATLENEAAIDAAYYAYYQLPEEERANVTNWADLLALREALPVAYVVGERQGTRVPWHKLRIGTYVVTRWSDEDMKLLADAGIDFIAAASPNSAEALDMAEKNGVGLILSAGYYGLPSLHYWNCMSTEAAAAAVAPTMMKLRQTFEANVVDHPAIWGIDLVDEPHVEGFAMLGRDNMLYQELEPDWMTYINLLGNYVSNFQSGARSYEQYIRKFHEFVDVDYTCFDHYMYGTSTLSNLHPYINNLDIAAKVDQELGKETWVVIQANSNVGKPLSINKMKLQAYVAMAYGAKSINWACWADSGWYAFNILDAEGKPTQRYYDVQSVNADLNALGPVYMRYTWNDVCAIGDVNGALALDFDFGDAYGVKEEYLDMYGYLTQEEYEALDVGNGYTDGMYHNPQSGKTKKIKVDRDFLEQNDVTMDQTTFTDFAVDQEKAAVLVGHFVKSAGEGEAIMLVNMTDHNFLKKNTMIENPDIDLSCAVTFKVADPDAVVTCYVKGIPTVLESVDGVYTVNLNTADAAFVTVE